MRKPIIAGNWKLNKNVGEALDLASELKRELSDLSDREVIVAPVFTALSKMAEVLQGSNIQLAAQNCYPEKSGAFTGEVSPPLLKDVGCSHIIVGHSERRQIFQESNTFINKKVHAILDEDLQVIYCIGETLEEREEGRMFDILTAQIKEGLKGIAPEAMKNIVLAYEPVWAIGTGKTATDEQAQEAHSFVRDQIGQLYGQVISDGVRILYGGSVKPANVDGLMKQPDVDGALVGGASLKASDFIRIVRFE